MIRRMTITLIALAILTPAAGLTCAQAQSIGQQQSWPGDTVVMKSTTRTSAWLTTVRLEPEAAPTSAPRSGAPAVVGALPPVRTPKPAGRPVGDHSLSGIASFYWQDQMTANGERFDKTAMTAAHKTLPFGTRVRVTDQASGRSVVVRINDRGPFKPGRVIDLSQAAAQRLGMHSRGIAPVKIEVVSAQ